VRGRVIRVSDRHHASVDVGGQRVDSVEDRLRHTAGLVDDHKHVPGMDALEGGLVVVGWLAAVPDEFLADVPLRVERDPPGQLCLAMGRADVAPEDRLDLRRGRRGGDDEGFAWWMHVDPPTAEPRNGVGTSKRRGWP
jgi:hypothetical protein